MTWKSRDARLESGRSRPPRAQPSVSSGLTGRHGHLSTPPSDPDHPRLSRGPFISDTTTLGKHVNAEKDAPIVVALATPRNQNGGPPGSPRGGQLWPLASTASHQVEAAPLPEPVTLAEQRQAPGRRQVREVASASLLCAVVTDAPSWAQPAVWLCL